MSSEVIERRPSLRRPALGGRTAAAAAVRGHGGILAVLAIGALLRIAALVAIYPGIWFSDSNGYVRVAATGTLSPLRTSAYSLLVWPFLQVGSAGALIVFQHLLGLAMPLALYAVLVRRGVPKWLAVLAAVPLALDAYLIVVEHTIMSDTLFDALAVAVIALLLWWERPGPVAVTAAGLLLGFAVVVRGVGLPFLAVFFLYVLARRLGPLRVALFVVAALACPLAYAGIYHSQHGAFALTQYSSRFLYARVAPFADCRRLHGLPADERRLCPPPGLHTPTDFLWSPRTPLREFRLDQGGPIRDFAVRVIRDQPVRYARLVVGSVLHFFEPGHRIGPDDYPDTPWRFPADPTKITYPGYRGPIRPGRRGDELKRDPRPLIGRMTGKPHTVRSVSKLLSGYQRLGYTSGQVLAVCVLLALAALVTRRGRGRLRLDAALLTAATLVALVTATAVSIFSYRYGLTAVVLLPAAGALGLAALLEGRPAR